MRLLRSAWRPRSRRSGQALFRHYGLDTETFQTNLVLIDGRAYAKLDSVAVVCASASAACWRLLSALRLLPGRLPTGSTIALRSTATPCSAAPTAA